MEELGTYPFGAPLQRVVQRDRTPKRVFVLGVYASAVHARWVGPDGVELVRALAVASEPTIFWVGDGADEIVSRIEVPTAAGRLVAAAQQSNGPSGRALDSSFLTPLGIRRADAWLCDLVPHTCLNKGQRAAIEEKYVPRAHLGLPTARLPVVPKQFADDLRRREILDELDESKADVVVLLGDEPIRWWLTHYDWRRKTLGDFGRTVGEYGRLHDVTVSGRRLRVLPLTHPRNVAGLGFHSPEWRERHDEWTKTTAPDVLGR